MRPNDLRNDQFYTNRDDRLGTDSTPTRGDILKSQIFDAFGADDPDVMDEDYLIEVAESDLTDAQRAAVVPGLTV